MREPLNDPDIERLKELERAAKKRRRGPISPHPSDGGRSHGTLKGVVLAIIAALLALAGREIKARIADHSERKPAAMCADRTYSYSSHKSGTCANHGGVLRWIDPPKD